MARPAADAVRLQQHPFYATTLAALGAQVGVLEDDGTTLVVERRIGPLWLSWLPAPRRLPDFTKLHRITLLSARDMSMDAALRGTGAIPVMTPQTHAVLDLARPDDLRRSGMHQKWRNRLSSGERKSLTVTHSRFGAAPGHWLLPLDRAQRQQRGYRALPHSFALSWPDSRLFVARSRGTPIAALLLLLHHPGATYHIGWSGWEGRAASAQNLLIWQASCWLNARGFTQLDLGVVDTVRSAGLARFKLGTGARCEQSGHTWLYSRATAPLGRLIG
ncbi:GNAT family N-acetyltransferase [Pseudooceanicola sediminis]|uniref:GNAT family N-acetyltransferase n=1 Tax=Pseudooceanicola sediminis TaxID=2211117 RepID=UPI001314FE1C|nr:GNAT family N-acetyltransferase [Pseudooceanicola sediminis]